MGFEFCWGSFKPNAVSSTGFAWIIADGFVLFFTFAVCFGPSLVLHGKKKCSSTILLCTTEHDDRSVKLQQGFEVVINLFQYCEIWDVCWYNSWIAHICLLHACYGAKAYHFSIYSHMKRGVLMGKQIGESMFLSPASASASLWPTYQVPCLAIHHVGRQMIGLLLITTVSAW